MFRIAVGGNSIRCELLLDIKKQTERVCQSAIEKH